MNIATIIASVLLLIISIFSIVKSFISAKEISKIPATRRQFTDATSLAVESIGYLIIWAMTLIILTIIWL
jgi:hypothetical protein